jgi:RimJ/RimL family protein N-acetyltransferase
MSNTRVLITPRLALRPWRESDLPVFAEQNADPETMRFLGGPMTRDESDAYALRARDHLATHGFGKLAVEVQGVAPFIGAVGISHVRFDLEFTPAVEIAWRFNRRYWGLGYATEAARAALTDGFDHLGFTEVVAMTALINLPSQRVMQRLGMKRSIEFDHPRHPEGSPVRRHVLYRIGRA